MCVIYAQLHCISITIAYRLLVGSTFLCSLQRVSTSEFPGFKLKRSSSFGRGSSHLLHLWTRGVCALIPNILMSPSVTLFHGPPLLHSPHSVILCRSQPPTNQQMHRFFPVAYAYFRLQCTAAGARLS